MLDDFLALQNALFADRDNDAIRLHNEVQPGESQMVTRELSKLEKLVQIWTAVLPNRQIIVNEYRLDVRQEALGSEYAAAYMSDGERTVLYFIAHVLLAPSDVTLLIDEPELHLHESIQTLLWDELEAARRDLQFIYITHNLAFAASRARASCVAVNGYTAAGPSWDWQMVPQDSGLPEEVVLKVLGSRRNTIFVEGAAGSLDEELYRAAYPTHFIVPAGKCDSVIRTVQSFRSHASLHHCAVAGIIDLDDRDEVEVRALENQVVFALGVAQVENVFALESVFRYVADHLVISENEATEKMARATARLELILTSQREAIISKRALHNVKRKFTSAAVHGSNKGQFYSSVLSGIFAADACAAYCAAAKVVDDAIAAGSHDQILRALRSKGAVGIVANCLGVAVENYLRIAILGVRTSDPLRSALIGVLPEVA